MPIPRSYILNLGEPGWVHAISRCVRKAWLAGKGCEHRKDWVEDRLRQLAGVFGCEVAAYAVMSNHLHVVVRMRPDVVRTWDAERLAQGWFALFPGRGRILPDGTALPPEPGMLRGFLADPARIAMARERLGHLSWFMKCLKEGIARRANAEDDCTGAFWEGRYTSVPLLDQHALLSCMAYVDLNPVRAGIADRPERSRHTSARQRGRGRQRQRVAARSLKLPESRRIRVLAAATIPPAEAPAVAADPECGQWLHPVRRCVAGSCDGAAVPDPARRDLLVLSSEEYLTLVDATGRLLVHGKRSRIPPGLPPILARLDLSVDAWLASMGEGGQLGTGSAGTPASREAEARRRGVQWVRSRCHLFTRRPRAA